MVSVKLLDSIRAAAADGASFAESVPPEMFDDADMKQFYAAAFNDHIRSLSDPLMRSALRYEYEREFGADFVFDPHAVAKMYAAAARAPAPEARVTVTSVTSSYALDRQWSLADAFSVVADQPAAVIGGRMAACRYSTPVQVLKRLKPRDDRLIAVMEDGSLLETDGSTLRVTAPPGAEPSRVPLQFSCRLSRVTKSGHYVSDVRWNSVSFLHATMDRKSPVVVDERSSVRRDWFSVLVNGVTYLNVSPRQNGVRVTFTGEPDSRTAAAAVRVLEEFISGIDHDIDDSYYKTVVPVKYWNASRNQTDRPRVAREIATNRMLRLTVPELFVTDYPRKCLHLPRIASEDEQVPKMLFPVKGEPTPPRYYACDHHSQAVHPGLRENPLANRDVFPYIPCCYISDQRARVNSDYNRYFNGAGDSAPARKTVDGSTFTTTRALPAGVWGFLTPAASKCFGSLRVERRGVDEGRSSALACLTAATGVVGRPDVSGDFVDPRSCYKLLEHWYDVNIVIFENRGDSIEMSRLTPRPVTWPLKSRTVCLVVNSGSVADALPHPRVELLYADRTRCVFDPTDAVQTIFDRWCCTVRTDGRRAARVQHVVGGYTCALDDGPPLDSPLPVYPDVPSREYAGSGVPPELAEYEKRVGKMRIRGSIVAPSLDGYVRHLETVSTVIDGADVRLAHYESRTCRCEYSIVAAGFTQPGSGCCTMIATQSGVYWRVR